MSIVVLQGRSAAEVRPADLTLILLHHAGGSAGSFVPLLPHLPSSWCILAPELPARATTPKQAPASSLAEAVDTFADALTEQITGPYAVLGHCLGALIGFELAHRLEDSGRPAMWVGVSGSPAPHLVAAQPAAGPPQNWSREEFIAYMRRLGGTPEALYDNRVLTDRMIAALRNDLVLNHGYRYSPRTALRPPLAILRGLNDPLVPAEEMAGWAERADGTPTVHAWPGDHFYLFERAPEVGPWLVNAITAAARPGDCPGNGSGAQTGVFSGF